MLDLAPKPQNPKTPMFESNLIVIPLKYIHILKKMFKYKAIIFLVGNFSVNEVLAIEQSQQNIVSQDQ